MAFDNEKFKATMRAKGFTQKALAEILGKTERTINDWLSPSHKLKAEEVDRLCQSIGEEPTEFDPDWVGSVDTSHKARVSAHVSSAAKNGFWLLKDRYGVTEKEVIELAPTLFAIVVEHARQAPHKYKDAYESLREHSHELGLGEPNERVEIRHQNENSIKALEENKIFGYSDQAHNPGMPGNLFKEALKEMCINFPNVSIGRGSNEGDCPTSRSNVIDKEFISEIADGDNDLIEAVASGDIELFSKEFESFSDLEKRIDWMRNSYVKILEERENQRETWRAKYLEERKTKSPDVYEQYILPWELERQKELSEKIKRLKKIRTERMEAKQ